MSVSRPRRWRARQETRRYGLSRQCDGMRRLDRRGNAGSRQRQRLSRKICSMAGGAADAGTVPMADRCRGLRALAPVGTRRHAGTDRPRQVRPDRERPAPGNGQRLTRHGLGQHKDQKQTTHGISRLHGIAMPRLQTGVHRPSSFCGNSHDSSLVKRSHTINYE